SEWTGMLRSTIRALTGLNSVGWYLCRSNAPVPRNQSLRTGPKNEAPANIKNMLGNRRRCHVGVPGLDRLQHRNVALGVHLRWPVRQGRQRVEGEGLRMQAFPDLAQSGPIG